jgi:phosphoribosyl-ATP pyrophosphohydrolase/phosphoribosyl-AMP cyclohydrolase/histidinol dehydrogenase
VRRQGFRFCQTPVTYECVPSNVFSCGDYASGTNHTLPTYGYARQFSGVNTLSFQKHITSQELTREGLSALGPVVVRLAEREGLEGHANAVRVRLAELA